MPSEHRKPTVTSRRQFAKSLFPAVLALQLGGGPEVEAQEKKQNRQKKQNRRRKKKRIRQTSPITVGGGGGGRPGIDSQLLISIDFDHFWFKKNNPNKPNQYWNRFDMLEKLWITNHWGKKKKYPVNETITIHCIRESDQQDSPIKVTAFPLGIEFIESDFPYDNGKEVHFCTDRKITTIDIDGRPRFTAVNGLCSLDIDDP